MIVPLPPELAGWHETPRVRMLNNAPVSADGQFVLCWLQQALRAQDNPVIDAAIRLGNAHGLPVLVYHGIREDYPYASDRLHRFILGASRDLARDCADRGLACVQFVDRAEKREKGLVYRLAAEAAAAIVEDQPTFVARWQAQRVAENSTVAVIAVNAACLVPPPLIGAEVASTSAFRRQHVAARDDWQNSAPETPSAPPYAGLLPFTPDRLIDYGDADLDDLVASLAIDHSLPVSSLFPAGRDAAVAQLRRMATEVLPVYAALRNDATQPRGASGLSPYLHFGVLGPREVMAAVNEAKAAPARKDKFADELLTWREWFHYRARSLECPEAYDRLPIWARETLAEHGADPRPDLETFADMLNGATKDETWNACQRQFLIDGWMHNNLRMYWGKRIIAMTPSPEAAWATACYLNDRLSLDGRDPATYGNIADMFGGGAPGSDRAVYGRVPTRSDGSTRKRPNGADWLNEAKARPVPTVFAPDSPPVDPYLTGEPAV